MSRITFNLPNKCTEIHGSERAWFGGFAQDALILALSLWEWNTHPLRKYAPEWVKDESSAKLYFGGISCKDIAGYDQFALQLNTMISMGSDFVVLAAKIHGMCEVHGFVEPSDFEWFAKTIQNGLDSGFYRKGQGWEKLISFVEDASGQSYPIVMNYSVTNSFPNSWLMASTREEANALSELPATELWDRCLNVLRKSDFRIGKETELFSHEKNGYQLMAELTVNEISA